MEHARSVPINVKLEFRYTRDRFDELYEKIARVELPAQNEVFEAHRDEWNALVKKLVMFYEKYELR